MRPLGVTAASRGPLPWMLAWRSWSDAPIGPEKEPIVESYFPRSCVGLILRVTRNSDSSSGLIEPRPLVR